MTDESTADLHDAVLVGIHFDWSARSCRLDFSGSPSRAAPFSIVIAGVSELSAPSRQPWGRSSSVLAARRLDGGGLELEMQSGDTIRVVVDDALRAVSPPPMEA